MWPPARLPSASSVVWSLAVCVLLAAIGAGMAQAADPIPAVRAGQRVLVDVSTLARRYGWSVSADRGVFTLRTDGGILTLFADSPDALWQPVGVAEPETVPLSQPPQVSDGAWYAPIDALQVLGIAGSDDSVAVPNGTATLAFPPQAPRGAGFEVVDLGNGVRALRIFQPGVAGPETLSMLIADLALLALALPEQQDILDRVLTDGPMATDHPLLIAVTALEAVRWEPSLVFEQDDLRFEARHPFRFQLVEGEVDMVGPDRPVIGVALLPARFSLERPMTVRWGDVAGDITFRPGR